MAKNNKKYDPKRRAELLAEFEASGMGAPAFCEKHGLAYATFAGWRKKQAGGKAEIRRGRQGPVGAEQRKLAVEAYQKSGMSKEHFAKTWGVGYSTLQHWIRVYEEEGPQALERPSLKKGAKKRGRKGIALALREEIVEAKRENPGFGMHKVAGFLVNPHRAPSSRASTGAVKIWDAGRGATIGLT